MKSWLISIVATVLLTVLLELLISEGTVKKYIHGFIGLLLLIVIITPIIKFKRGDFTVQIDERSIDNSEYDYSFINSVTEKRYEQVKKKIISEMHNNGIDNADIQISTYFNEKYVLIIDRVYVDLSNSIISDEIDNIIRNEMIIDIVQTYLDVTKEQIIIYGDR